MVKYFVFNDKSSQELGVHIAEAPNRTIPKIRTNIIENDYTNGSIIKFRGASTFELSIKIGFDTRKNREEEIYMWLSTGQTGKLSFSDDLERYYEVSLYDEIDFVQAGRFFKTATLKFIAQPFRKYTVQTPLIYNNPNTDIVIVNEGNYFCEPIITITGTGQIGFELNDELCNVLEFGNTSRTLVINSEEKDCTLPNGTLANRSMNGQFPKFKTGVNHLTLGGTGTVSKMEVVLNERWL